jgi:hypothetical protein
MVEQAAYLTVPAVQQIIGQFVQATQALRNVGLDFERKSFSYPDDIRGLWLTAHFSRLNLIIRNLSAT